MFQVEGGGVRSWRTGGSLKVWELLGVKDFQDWGGGGLLFLFWGGGGGGGGGGGQYHITCHDSVRVEKSLKMQQNQKCKKCLYLN